MPRKLVIAAWNEMFPDGRSRLAQPRTPVNHSFVEVLRLECEIGDLDSSEAEDCLLDRIARPLAQQFLISSIAMRILLEKLGLFYRQVPHQSILTHT